MNQSTEKVAVTLSHNQAVNGVEHVAGDTIEVDPRLARALKARGAAQIDSKADIQAALAAAPKTAADSAEKGGAR